ncbi:MAG: hypothetical protein LUG96_08350 [Tannerellaceae bacterium]|nr:hypothetical protein [Tannerellaceae bacterium]MCC8199072.1 hypothetical protein [Tannerellaceae bacterium]MCD7915252.1 hypothetical protein [Tannerellaceae bacterium]
MKKYANKLLLGLVIFTLLIAFTRGILSIGYLQAKGQMRIEQHFSIGEPE